MPTQMHVLQSPEDVFVELAADPAVRFKSPDGSNTVNGIAHPPFITQQSWNFVKSTFKPKEADVWVATYPKVAVALFSFSL